MSNQISRQNPPFPPDSGESLSVVTRPSRAPGAGDRLTSAELTVADRVARRLHNDLRGLLDKLPADARHASGLARALDIDRTTCQRAVFVATRPYPGPELLTRLPGIKGLQQIAERARAKMARGAREQLDALDASIQQFQSVISTLAGSQSRLIRRLDATGAAAEPSAQPDRAAGGAAGARQRLFHAASELTGRTSDCWLAIYLYNPAPANDDALELIRANGLIGHQARPDAVPLVFHSFASKPPEPESGISVDGAVRPLIPAAGDGVPDSMLREFSTDHPPFVSTAQPNEFCVQSIDERPGAGHGPVDLLFATRTLIAHPALRPPRVEEAWALVNFPCKRLLFDIYLHRDLARACLPSLDTHLWRPDFAQQSGSRWQTRFADAPSLQLLQPGLRASASDAWARHSELTRFLFERSDLDPAEFVGFRCDTTYPIWRAGYCLSFDFSTPGEDEGSEVG